MIINVWMEKNTGSGVTGTMAGRQISGPMRRAIGVGKSQKKIGKLSGFSTDQVIYCYLNQST
jgi:hypothetical protein